jgi:hypothetical protein
MKVTNCQRAGLNWEDKARVFKSINCFQNITHDKLINQSFNINLLKL